MGVFFSLKNSKPVPSVVELLLSLNISHTVHKSLTMGLWFIDFMSNPLSVNTSTREQQMYHKSVVSRNFTMC